MTLREIVKIVMAAPFRPFRIQLDDGTAWHVHDPEMIAVGKTKVLLSTWMSEIEDEAKTQELMLLMNHSTSIQFLD
jgi:hypothetical protein